MAKLKALETKRGQPLMLYISEEIAEHVKLIGGGVMSRGVNLVLDTYKKEIIEASKEASAKKIKKTKKNVKK